MNLWPVEAIPDCDSLFYRVPENFLRADRKPHPGVFSENKGSMSTDWDKYSTAVETRLRAPRPEKFAVLRMIVGRIREIDELSVIHSPIQNVAGVDDNRAHTDVFGLEPPTSASPDLGRKLRIRSELYKRFNAWEIAPGTPVGSPRT